MKSSLTGAILLFLMTQIGMILSESCPGGPSCLGPGNNYCSGSRIGATCVDGTCQCPDTPMRDRCTCLSVIGSCHIRSDATNATATPTSLQNGHATYSCVANDNCDNEVHVLGVYQSAQGSISSHPTGYPDVYISVVGSSSRPLILVLSSYEPAIWTLHIPNGVVISKVLISSFYENSIRTSGGQVLSVEDDLDFNGYGSDDGGGDTHELLLHLYERFGPVSSFTGIYEANEWTLTLDRGDPDSDCLSGPFQLPTSSSQEPTPPSQNNSFLPTIIGFGVPIVLIFLIPVLIILCITCKIKKSSRRPQRVSQATASRPSQHLQFSLDRQPALAGASLNSPSALPPYHTATKQVVTESLSNAEAPPSYADLEKEEPLPPPYSE